MPSIVLASGSPYRRELLGRLRVPFSQLSPEVDESPLPGEAPPALVRRLSLAKAQAVATRLDPRNRTLVIASDQAALLDGTILGKPGTEERAREQLRAASGRKVEFLTGLCLLDTGNGEYQLDCIPYAVHFRRLGEERIAAYVAAERPLDCAGSFRSEGLGIVLFERMTGDDPTALVGLPLIRLVSMLERAGITLPLSAQDGS
ncbi:MAG: septum formation inhibitor Maf [Gammaproteobacteria bacterium]|nr:MAG: septum formation inhibitor Maf [Gammaproteobacteria bacterium]